VLWDRTLETCKDKNLTLEAWREICKINHPDFESLDERKIKEIGKLFFVTIKFTCHKISVLSTYHRTVTV
jgi:hypothetical protein